jgi:hypothetical protein
VENPNRVTRGIAQLLLDGESLPAVEGMVPLIDDGREHAVKVILGDQRSVHPH